MEQRRERDDQKIDWLESQNAKLRSEVFDLRTKETQAANRAHLAELQNDEYKRAIEAISKLGLHELERGVHIAVAVRAGLWTEKPKDQDREVCWFAEVNQESKAACSVCKDVQWPRWYGEDGCLTNEPTAAKKFSCREDCLNFCTSGRPSHWHLYPTEHVFVSR